MTKFKNSHIKRVIRVPSINSDLNVEMDANGVSFWIAGSRTRVFASWDTVVHSSHTPTSVPSFLMDKPVELLHYIAAKNKK